jgi:PhnB protein
MQFINYLGFNGNCEEAFNFYKDVFRGEITAMFSHEGTPAEAHVSPEWKKKIMHACLVAKGAVLMGGDSPQGTHTQPAGFCVNISVDKGDYAEAERIFSELGEGGKVQMPIGETFWAKRFGMLIDKYGVPWMVNCE